MNKKCLMYESLFVFRNQDELNSHIKECRDCELEDLKMKSVSSLISEVKYHYLNRKINLKKFKIACVLFLFLFTGATFGLINFNADFSDTLKYGTTLSSEDLGFPVDSYGLIMVE